MVSPNAPPISRRRGILAALVAIGVAAGALYSPDARSCAANAAAAAPMKRTFELTIAGGKVVEAMRTIRVRERDSVRLRWTTDKPVVLHLHGYDIETRVAPGAVAEIAFEAHATGRFPIEVHGKDGAHGSGHHHGPLVIVEIYPR